MPAISGVYSIHPNTGVAGIWIALTGPQPGIIGIANTNMPALIPSSGTDAQKLSGFQTALNTNIQHQCDLQGTFPAPPVFGVAEPGCRWEGTTYM